MVLPERIYYTSDAFDDFTNLPENADRLFEYIGGEIVEVPSNPYVSEIANLIGFFIRLFLREKGLRGHVTGEQGGYKVAGERYAPDVAYISYERQPRLASQGYNPNPPDLAVEIISSDRAGELRQLRIKVFNYLSVGTIVWVVNPEYREVEVYAPGQSVTFYRENDTLDGGVVLPGFTLTVAEIFPEEPESDDQLGADK